MLKIKKVSVAALFVAAIALQLVGCGGTDTKPDYTAKSETKADPPKKVKEEPAETKEVAKKEVVEETEAATENAEVNEALNNKGIGPIKHVELGSEVDAGMAEAGKKVYTEKCTACHKATRRFVGPAPKGIMERRSPEWIMNMILNPEQMVKEDPIAIALLAEYNYSPMANQNLTEEEARSVLEYFRTL